MVGNAQTLRSQFAQTTLTKQAEISTASVITLTSVDVFEKVYWKNAAL